jgi:putative transposase
MIGACDLSERRACRLVGLSRDSYRNPPEADAMTQELSSKIVEIAHARRRFGYRRIHDMLRPHFPGVNHKRVYRLCGAANLGVRKRKKVKRPANERVPLQLATTVNEVWSMDFVSDSLSTGRRIKCLTVADDFSHECVSILGGLGNLGAIRYATAGSSGRVQRLPAGCAHRQQPGVHQSRLHGLGAGPRHPSHPDRAGTAHAERLHRELQRQVQGRVLNERWFETLQQARSAITLWRQPGLQRDQAAQQLRTNASVEVRRAASPARWRCSSIQLNNHRDQLVLQPRTSSL